VAVYNFISSGKIDWAGIGAAATLIVLPVSGFAFFMRRTIVQGLTMGALVPNFTFFQRKNVIEGPKNRRGKASAILF
jgi:hypothetical protein